MRNETRLKFNAYTTQIGKLNAVEDPSRSFTVAPAVAQTLRGKIQQSSAFLTSINIIPVVAQEGDKVGVGVRARSPAAPTRGSTTASRATRAISTRRATGARRPTSTRSSAMRR